MKVRTEFDHEVEINNVEDSENSVGDAVGNQAKKMTEDAAMSPAGDEEQPQCNFRPSMKIRTEYIRKAKRMTEHSVISSIRKRPFSKEKRGRKPERGRWISLEEAKMLAGNEEWWMETEKSAGAKPVATPKNEEKPIWLFESGKMHLGPWKSIQFGKGGMNCMCEVDYGITFEAMPPHRRGNCYVGQFLNGRAHGNGRSFWLKSSPSWKSNNLPGSQIKFSTKRGGRQECGLPYEYKGQFRDNKKHDVNGVATLKDGTKKVGRWFDDVIVGRDFENSYSLLTKHGVDWWTHHIDYDKSLVISSPATRAIEYQRKKEKRKKTPAAFSIRRPAKHRKEGTPSKIFATAAAPRNTIPSITAHPQRLPVNVTPDSSNVIDLCDSDDSVGRNDTSQSSPLMPLPETVSSEIFTNYQNNNIIRHTNGTRDSTTSLPSQMTMKHRATPTPDNVVSEVFSNPQNGTRNHSIVSTPTAQSRATPFPQSNTLVARVESSNVTTSFRASSAVPSQHRRRKLNDLAAVLREEAIGEEADHEEMEAYARELFALGFHSVKMILRFCHADEHVEKWPWMKPIHKMAFQNWLEAKRSKKTGTTDV